MVIVKDSTGVFQYMHAKKQICENSDSHWSSPLLHIVCAFTWLETSFRLKVFLRFNSFSEKVTSFSKHKQLCNCDD